MAHHYSYSFHRHYDWSRNYPQRQELLDYCDDAIARLGLRSHFRFNTGVDEVVWSDQHEHYDVRLANGERQVFDVVVSAVGLLNVPRYPDWPGLDEFAHAKFHTARWDHGVDLRGKRVAIVGTGCSSIQIVPEIAQDVAQLYIFQREPGWILPKSVRDYTASERNLFRRWPQLVDYKRAKLFYELHRLGDKGPSIGSKPWREARDECLKHIEASIKDPKLRELVTPKYAFGCKRPMFHDTYYLTLERPNVELVPHAVTRVTPHGVVDAQGVEREIDVLIMATGFQPWRFISSLKVRGPQDKTLQELWGDSESLLGATVAGMPNFFMLYGPNTNGANSVLASLSRQSEVVVQALKRMRRLRLKSIDTRSTLQTRYVRWIDQGNARFTAYAAGCHNYYHADTGRNVTQNPLSGPAYWLLSKMLPRLAFIPWKRNVAARTTSSEVPTAACEAQ